MRAPMSRRRRKVVLDEEWVSGLPVEQRKRILRRAGRSDQEISTMDANQQNSEVLEAIQFGYNLARYPPPQWKTMLSYLCSMPTQANPSFGVKLLSEAVASLMPLLFNNR